MNTIQVGFGDIYQYVIFVQVYQGDIKGVKILVFNITGLSGRVYQIHQLYQLFVLVIVFKSQYMGC